MIAAVAGLAVIVPSSHARERPILGGRWDTKFEQVQSQNTTSIRHERRWVFRRRMRSHGCKLLLKYELTLGGFDHVCLHRRGRKYIGETTANQTPCGKAYEPGRTTERFSVRVLGSEVGGDGRRYATRIEAYYRARYESSASSACASSGREVRHYTGRRLDTP